MRFYNLPLLPLRMNLDSITLINLSYNNYNKVIYKKKLKFLMELDKSFKITKLKKKSLA